MRGLQWSCEVLCESEETENTRRLTGTTHPRTTDSTPWGQMFLLFFEGGGGERRRKSKGKTQRNMLKGLVAPKVPLPRTFVVLSQSLEWEFSFPQEESEGKQGNRK